MTGGPLDGVLVADFSRILAGPYAAMTLGDLGATVIKVERSGSGDDTRTWGPPWSGAGQAAYFDGLNRNKYSVEIDLDDADDADLARELAARADVMIENFLPGTLERFGLDHASVESVNPRIVYCSITAFGSRTAAARKPGYDLLVQAVGGLMSVTGAEAPTKVGVAVVDHLAALQAAVGIVTALYERAISGRGQRVEVSLLHSCITGLLNQASGYLATGCSPTRTGNRHPSIVPYQPFRTADGWLVVACGNDAQFARLAAALQLGWLCDDDRFVSNEGRVSNVDALDHVLSDRFEGHTTEHWVAVLSDAGVPVGPINDIGAAFEFAEHLGVAVRSVVDGTTTVRSPIELSRTPTDVRLRPPSLGEHDELVRRWIRGEISTL